MPEISVVSTDIFLTVSQFHGGRQCYFYGEGADFAKEICKHRIQT